MVALAKYLNYNFSPEVAQFLNLSIPECHAILKRYDEEEDKELQRIKEKWV